MLVKTNWRISRTQEPKWLLPRPTKTTSLQKSLKIIKRIIMNGDVTGHVILDNLANTSF